LISVFISSKLKIIFKKYKTINEEKLKAEYEATHDSLTNAFNRASFNKKFSKELLRAKRYKTPLCIAILDIDHFKKINDTYGHHIGDVVLKKLVEFIQKNIRDSDFFARWGGEEFVLIFPQTKGEDAKLKCEQLKESLKNDKNTQTPATFTFSCGVAEYQEGDTLDDLLQKADKALYSAKETRDRVILST
jgi:diguanylate cyclase (GGDEF)-like protein